MRRLFIILLIIALSSCAERNRAKEPESSRTYSETLFTTRTLSPISKITNTLTNLEITKTISPSIITQTSTMQVDNSYVVIYLRETEGDLFAVDYLGNSRRIFDMANEEKEQPTRPKMKISPDWSFLAYIGKNNGNSTIKIVNVGTGEKVYQEEFDNGTITDFAWSKDSKTILVALYGNGDDGCCGNIFLIYPFTNNPPEKIIGPDNMQITQMEWISKSGFVYAYLSSVTDKNKAYLGSYDISTKKQTNRAIMDIEAPTFWFVVSPDNKSLYFYLFNKGNYDPASWKNKLFSTDTFDEIPCKWCIYPRLTPIWWGHYMFAVLYIIAGSPDQEFILTDTDTGKMWFEPGPGPSGWIVTMRLVERNGQIFSIDWGDAYRELSICNLGSVEEFSLFERRGECKLIIAGVWIDSARIEYS